MAAAYRPARMNLWLLAISFVVCGFLHVFLYGVAFTDNIAQLFCGTVILCWAFSARKRVIDRVLSNLLMAASAAMLFFLLMQIVNYKLAVPDMNIRRHAWYAYYLSVMVVCEIIFYISVSIYREAFTAIKKAVFYLPGLAGAIFALGILTNDLHFAAFRFHTEIMAVDSSTVKGPLFYLIYACFILLLFHAFLIMLRKSRMVREKNSWILPAAPYLFLLVYLILNWCNRKPEICGIPVWQMGEVFCYTFMFSLESCIENGLIPSNTDYESFFSMAGIPAVITDRDENVKYISRGTSYPFEEDENMRILEQPISGGMIRWAEDVSTLRRLNRELMEASSKIDARNAYLAAEAKVRKEKAEFETRNRIYDNITRIVRPQLDRISTLLDQTESPFDDRVKKISVMCAYIKRRSNMELVSEDGSLPFEELSLALRETIEYVRLCGINAELSADNNRKENYPSDMLCAVYEEIESVIEESLESATDLMIFVRGDERGIQIRLMLRAEELTLPADSFRKRDLRTDVGLSVTKEGEDLILCCKFTENTEKEGAS